MKKGEFRQIRISSEYSDYSLEAMSNPNDNNQNQSNDYSKQMCKQINSKYLGKRNRSSINDQSQDISSETYEEFSKKKAKNE